MNGEAPQVVDMDVLNLLHDAIGDGINKIITLYLQEVPKDLASMQQAIITSDLTTVGRLAHSLKASSANLGAMQTSALAAELEHSIAHGEDDQVPLELLIHKIQNSFDQTRTIYEKLNFD